jgi:hypothetical protein
MLQKWLNYRLAIYEEYTYGQSRQTAQGSEKTQETAGTQAGALIREKGPRHRAWALPFLGSH